MALLWDLSQGDESALDRIEANLVGSILCSPGLLGYTQRAGLKPADFHRKTVGLAYGGIVAFCAAHPASPDDRPGPLDPVLLAHFLDTKKIEPTVRWPWLLILGRLTDDPSMDEDNATEYAKAIIAGAARRSIANRSRA